MKVYISQPSKSAMQSGRRKKQAWIMEYESPSARRPDPLMGWTSSADTLNQVRLTFDTLDAALEFAGTKGWEAVLLPAHQRKITPRNYTDNFRYVPPQE